MRQSGVNQPYNLRLGPVTLRVEANATANFNDNIGLTKNDRISDIILTPIGTLHTHWQVSDLNAIDFNVGLGYEFYLLNSQYNSLIVSPDSEAAFNFFVGDVAFNFHDQFSYEQDPTQIGQLSDTVRLTRWSNDVGISATWDLNTFVLELAYDHSNLWVTEEVYKYLTNQTDTIAPKITWKVEKGIDAGISMSVTSTRYAESFQNDSTNLSVGPFVTAQLSENLSVQGQFGGYLTDYDQGGGNGDTQNIESYYGSAGVTHRINDTMTQSATVGREFLPGLTSNFTERVYANYTFSWQTTKTINTGATFFWENLNDSESSFSEQSDRYGFGLSGQDYLTDKCTLNFNYQYLLKQADPSDLSYTQNSVTFGVNYQF